MQERGQVQLMHMSLPNILTLLRMALIPVFVIVFYLPWVWAPLVSATVFTVAALTDLWTVILRGV